MTIQDGARFYRENGFVLAPKIIPDELTVGTRQALDEVRRGVYDTGVPPLRAWYPEDDEGALPGAFDPHLANRTIRECACHPELARWALELADAEWVQVWATFATIKDTTNPDSTIGWHYDACYWAPFWENPEEGFGAWIALDDVAAEDGALRFVKRSHRWSKKEGEGLLFQEHSEDLDDLKGRITVPEGERWEEAVAELRQGEVSFHHSATWHGSKPNTSGRPRLGMTVMFRTDRARIASTALASGVFTDPGGPHACPVVHRQP